MIQTTAAITPKTDATIRPLVDKDFEAVVALDRRITGSARRGYFEKRLQAALRQPKRHMQFAAWTPNGLVGFALARQAGGEYGRPDEVLVLESVGVDPAVQHGGTGRRMMEALEKLALSHGIRSIVTQVDWHNHAMMRFLDGARFSLASIQIVERPVHRMPLPATDEEIEAQPPLVRHLRSDDLERLITVDHLITGQNRSAYFRRKMDEVLHESAIAVSLVVEDDGFVVGFAMVRVDFGDFGHVVPTASLDTIGIHPGFTHKGHARAMLTQMIDNLSALHVERLETEVPRDNFALLRFLYRFGFGPSERLAFERKIA